MTFGICTSLENASTAREAGWDYIEPSAQRLLKGTVEDEAWSELEAKPPELPVRAVNMLVPAGMKITGPAVDIDALRQYMERVTRRAKQVGVSILVFGSGGARQVPEGFDRDRARQQILDFGRISAELAAKNGVTIVLEPLHRGECNIINTVAEAMEYVREINHPNFQCLLDTYHFWMENEPLENLIRAMSSIRHVHVADRDGRVAPGESGTSDYEPIFRVLRRFDYRGSISVEASKFEPAGYFTTLEYLKGQWQRAGSN